MHLHLSASASLILAANPGSERILSRSDLALSQIISLYLYLPLSLPMDGPGQGHENPPKGPVQYQFHSQSRTRRGPHNTYGVSEFNLAGGKRRATRARTNKTGQLGIGVEFAYVVGFGAGPGWRLLCSGRLSGGCSALLCSTLALITVQVSGPFSHGTKTKALIICCRNVLCCPVLVSGGGRACEKE